MGSMSTFGGIVDERGLTRDLTDDEMLTLAGQIGQITEVVDLAAGDLINQFCKRKGLPELTRKSAEFKGENFSPLLPLIKTMG